MNNFKVVSSEPTIKGNFCTKLQAKIEVVKETPFGKCAQKRQSTYYIFLEEKCPIGTVAPLDISQFDVRVKPYTSPDGEEMELKYLYPKV